MDSTQWQSTIKSCLDILRNGKSKFDGLKAINEFITLITLKLVENRIQNENENDENDENYIIPIGNECKIKNLYEKYCSPEKIKDSKNAEKNADLLFDLIYNKSRVFDINQNIDDNFNVISENKTRNDKKECILVRFNYYTDGLSHATKNISDNKTLTSFESKHAIDVQNLIIKIHESFKDIDLNKFGYDAFGEAYEKVMTDEIGTKRYGQYFTKRDLIDLIIDELNIKPTDKCYDPTCGTGGFILGFAKKHKNNKNFINNNIHGQELIDEVHKSLCFNMLAHNIDGCLKNILNGDSMEKSYHIKVKDKYDIIGANPPFGMSFNSCSDEYKIKVKDSVGLFLQHIYFSLKDGGRAGVVIDRGILNNGTDKKNSWHTRLRKFLLENCKFTKIINLPTGIFKHTNFATSVIFFTKGGITTDIKYIEGYFADSDKGKGDKTLLLGEEKILTMEQIKSNNYSLKSDDYFKIKEVKQDMDQWVRLGDVCEFQKGKSFNTSNMIKGQYKVIGGGFIPMKEYTHNKYNTEENEILISNDGAYAGYLNKFNEKIFITGHCNKIVPKNINKYFLWYYLKINQSNIIDNYQKGQAQPSLYKEKLLNEFMVPNIPLDHQTEIVEFLDKIYSKVSIDDTIKYMKGYNIFSLLIDKNYEGFNTIIWFQKNIPRLLKEKENIPKKKNYYIQSLFDSIRSKCQMMKLGDIVEFKNYKSVKIENASKTGKYPFYNCSIVGHLWSDEYLYEDEVLIMNKTNGSGKCHIFYNNGPFTISGGVIIFKSKEQLNIIYLHNYLNSYKYKISNMFVGGDKKNINICTFKNLEIPVPSLEIQEEIINKINKLNEQSSHYDTYAKVIQTELDNITETIQNMTKCNI